MRTSRTLGVLAAPALLTPALALGLTSTAYVDGESCDGQPATMVVPADAPAGPVDGTDGADVIVVLSTAHVVVQALGGDDVVCGGTHTDVMGGAGDDTIELGGAAGDTDLAAGGAGDDTIHGGPGKDVVDGGPGDDTLTGGDGGDWLSGGGDSDSVSGGAGPDVLDGGLSGRVASAIPGVAEEPVAPGHDVLDGGAGSDLVVDSASTDTLVGGGGWDSLFVGDPDLDTPAACGSEPGLEAPVLDVDAGTVTGAGASADTFTGFERYVAGPATDVTLLGGQDADHLGTTFCSVHPVVRGGPERDVFVGSSCDADIDLGQASDRATLDGYGRLEGGESGDVLAVGPSVAPCAGHAPLVVAGGPGIDTFEPDSLWRTVDLRHHEARGGHPPATLTGLENVHVLGAGPGARETIIGTNGPNHLVGSPASSRILGLGGNDVLRGGAGRDVLNGGTGRDRAWGGSGRDVCRGVEVRHSC